MNSIISKRARPTMVIRNKIPIKKETILLILLAIVLLVIIISLGFVLRYALSSEDYVTAPNQKCNCLNVLDYGVKGKWVRQTRSHDQSHYATDKDIRRALLLPDELHRSDLRCGLQFPLPNTTLPSACDREGPHFCCSENSWCGNTSGHCSSTKSSDFSTLVQSNEGTWKQLSSECKLEKFTQKEACALLVSFQFNLIFIGDSEARKTLITLLLFLIDNFSTGVLKKNIDISRRQNCMGELQFLNQDCKQFTYDSSIFFDGGEVCGYRDAFLVEYFPDFNTFLTSATGHRIQTLKGMQNTFVILNVGAHFNANPQSFIQYYLRPLTDMTKEMKWPKLVVETLPKGPSIILSEKRRAFRDAVVNHCTEHGVSVLDNFDLSTNLMPFDGKHFRLPFYLQKLQILLNFLRIQKQSC